MKMKTKAQESESVCVDPNDKWPLVKEVARPLGLDCDGNLPKLDIPEGAVVRTITLSEEDMLDKEEENDVLDSICDGLLVEAEFMSMPEEKRRRTESDMEEKRKEDDNTNTKQEIIEDNPLRTQEQEKQLLDCFQKLVQCF